MKVRISALFCIMLLHVLPALYAQNLTLDKKYPQDKVYLFGRLPQTFYFPGDLHVYGYVYEASALYNADFTLYGITGAPDGVVFEALYNMFFKGYPAPPYEIGFGYKFKNSHWGIGARVLHYKYIMDRQTEYAVQGNINSTVYDGSTQPFDFLQNYEHTDGHNLGVIGGEYWNKLFVSKNEKHFIDLSVMLGAVMAYPRTDATVKFPDGVLLRNNNDYKITGGGVYAEAAVHFQVFKYWNINVYGGFSTVYLKNDYTIVLDNHRLFSDHLINSFTLGIGTGVNLVFDFKKKKNKEITAP